MTIRKIISPAASRGLVISTVLVSLTGCGMINSVVEQDKVDYRGAKKAPPLDIPPDLTQLQKDNRYSVPDVRGVATASSYQNRNGAGAPVAVSGTPVGAVNTETMRVERAGNQRWLVVNQTPEQLWPQLKDFWANSGFAIVTESTAAGTMETDWTENRAKIPQDFLRRTIGRVFDSLYSTGERDKFRTRLERSPSGGTEIYISHRGAEEVYTGPQKDSTAWTGRTNDPGLEAYFLASLMTHLKGAPDDKAALAEAKSTVEGAKPGPEHAKLVAGADGAGSAGSAGSNYVEVDEGFDRAWRRVGLALDRVGFTVEDRDRVQGLYFVRYVDPDATTKKGFFGRLFSFGKDDKDKEAQRYRVLVKTAAGASTSQVTVQSNDGKPETSATGQKILKLLYEELK